MISSISRMAWKTGSVCGPAAASMWRDSEASPRLAGGTRSAAAPRAAVSGCCASQSISRPGTRARSSRAIARSRAAWPRPIGEDTSSAHWARAGARVQRRSGCRGAPSTRVAKSRISALTRTGSRALGAWPEPSRTTSSPRVSSATRRPRSSGVIVSRSPWMTSAGQRTPATSASTSARLVYAGGASIVRSRTAGPPARPPPDASLPLLLRVALGEHLGEEEVEVAAVVAAPGRAGVARPALVAARVLVEARHAAAGRVLGREAWHRGRDRDDTRDAPGVQRGEQQRGRAADGEAHDDRALGAGGVEHREGVADLGEHAVARGVLRTVRAARPAGVERDDAEVAGESGDLRLPDARVDDRPRRHEQDRPRARAEHLVADADTTGVDGALDVRLERAHRVASLLARDVAGQAKTRWGP